MAVPGPVPPTTDPATTDPGTVDPGTVDPARSDPGSRVGQPVLREGDLLASRYRLVRAVPTAAHSGVDAGPAVLWLAQDEVLARPVAAKVLLPGGPDGSSFEAAARPFLQAAAASGGLAHPVLARVYDAAVEQRPAERARRSAGELDVAYVISEWVDGPSLVGQLTEDGPYDAVDAVELADCLAEALAAAHAGGLVHGRLHPGNVLLTRGGAVKLTDLGVSTALPERAVPALRAGDPVGPAADARDLAAVTYALLTARWPVSATPQPSGGLPAAPAGRDGAGPRGRLISPRQVRAGVPRTLDAVVVRALDPARAAVAPALTSAAGLAAALTGAVRADARALPAVHRPSRVPRSVRRLVPAVVLLGLLTILGVVAYGAGKSVGTVSDQPGGSGALTTPRPGAPAAPRPVPLAGAVVTDFDPPPGDGRERPGEVANAYDDDPSTAWRTERYGSATFGGLKPGVGLLVDLGAPTAVARVELAAQTDGAVVELRIADAAAADASGYRLVASGRSAGGALPLAVPAGTRARYYLLWVTELPRVEGRFVAGVRELRLLGP